MARMGLVLNGLRRKRNGRSIQTIPANNSRNGAHIADLARWVVRGLPLVLAAFEACSRTLTDAALSCRLLGFDFVALDFAVGLEPLGFDDLLDFAFATFCTSLILC